MSGCLTLQLTVTSRKTSVNGPMTETIHLIGRDTKARPSVNIQGQVATARAKVRRQENSGGQGRLIMNGKERKQKEGREEKKDWKRKEVERSHSESFGITTPPRSLHHNHNQGHFLQTLAKLIL